MTKIIYAVQVVTSGILAWISSKLGILFPVLGILLFEGGDTKRRKNCI